jgi:predicted nuclease of restriction endonuclease-like RecB superfamily
LLPANRIQVLLNGPKAIPVWLGAEDRAWLEALIEDFIRLDKSPFCEMEAFLHEPSRTPAPPGKRQMAAWMLRKMCSRQDSPINAPELRHEITMEAQQLRTLASFNRSQALAVAAGKFNISAQEAEELLFSDLPGERRLNLPDPMPDPHTLAISTNLALAQGLLRLASKITIELYGRARAVVKQVHLRRLLFTAKRSGLEGVRLEISGAFSLFRHTTMYGNALASILPALSWCNRFSLKANCVLRGRAVVAELSSSDPISLGEPPREYDSKLEMRFVRDFSKSNLDWDIIREPEPVEAEGALIFPDFALIHRRDPSRRFLLEIVGFWTPEYLQEKLRKLRSIPHLPLVLCIDRSLNCGNSDLPPHARVIWFKKKIDPQAVLAEIETAAPECPGANNLTHHNE